MPISSDFRPISRAVGTDDWPLSSISHAEIRHALEACSRERWYRAGWSTAPAPSSDRGLRLKSIRPYAYGPRWIYVPEQADTVDVRLQIERVDFDLESDGDEAVRLHATTGDPSGAYEEAPLDVGDWDVTLVRGYSGRVHLTARIPPGRIGWISVWIWCVSNVSAQVEDSGTSDGNYYGGVDVNGVTTPPGSPPERALTISAAVALGGKGSIDDDSVGGFKQVCYYDSSAGVMYVHPPSPTVDSRTNGWDWATHPIGVAEVSGGSLSVRPSTPLPGPGQYHGDAPASQGSAQALVVAANHLGTTRVPTWSASGADSRGTVYGVPWALRSDDAAESLDGIDTAAKSVAAALIPEAISDSSGYVGVCSLYVAIHPGVSPSSVWYTRALSAQWEARLAAYSLGASPSLVETGPWTTIDIVPDDQAVLTVGEGEQVPLRHQLWGVRQMPHWDLWGTLANGDIPRLRHVVVEMDEDSTTYPCQMRIEVRVAPGSGTNRESFLVLIAGGAIASRTITL